MNHQFPESATIESATESALTAITTLTMNPALDINVSVPHVMHTEKMRCGNPRYDAGGGGVNVARAIIALGGEATAIVTAGDHGGAHLLALIEHDGIPVRAVPVRDSTRESFTATDEQNRLQYRFVLPGPRLDSSDEARCLLALEQHMLDNGYLVVSGSLPPGCSDGFFGRIAELAAHHDCRLVVDTSGPALATVTGAYLIKPSIRELRDCVGAPLLDLASQIAAARELIMAKVSDGERLRLSSSLSEDNITANPAAFRSASLESALRSSSSIWAAGKCVARTRAALASGGIKRSKAS